MYCLFPFLLSFKWKNIQFFTCNSNLLFRYLPLDKVFPQIFCFKWNNNKEGSMFWIYSYTTLSNGWLHCVNNKESYRHDMTHMLIFGRTEITMDFVFSSFSFFLNCAGIEPQCRYRPISTGFSIEWDMPKSIW